MENGFCVKGCVVCGALWVVAGVAFAERNYSEDVAFLKKHTRIVELKSGGAAVAVAPDYQARVMTSTAGGKSAYSFGWLNDAVIGKGVLPASEAKGRLEEHIYVFGGEERFWLGPEGGQFGLYFAPGTPFDFASWKTPPALDTEPFETVTASADEATFQRRMTLRNWTGTIFEVQVTRRVRLLTAAQLAERWKIEVPAGASMVAYETDNRIANAGTQAWRPETGLVSVWMLGMYKPTPRATIVVPFRAGDEAALGPKVNDVYFGKIADSRLKVGDGVLFLRADGQSRGKIGIPPRRTLGTAGSYSADVGALTVVRCSASSGGRYVNSLWEKQKDPYAGDAINAYNDGSPAPGKLPLGPFFELETSSAAAELKPGESLEHRQVTVHIMGAEKILDETARRYLNASLDQIKDAFHVYTDPKHVDEDFRFQGEYSGTVMMAGRSVKLGAQLRALGNGTFRSMFFAGGLPGDGWDGKTMIQKAPTTDMTTPGDARLSDGKVVIEQVYRATCDGQVLAGKTDRGVPFELKRVHRQSPTMGAKPPAGAVVLFDGGNLDAWQKGASMTPQKWLSSSTGATSVRKFQDFTLHLEFMISYMPETTTIYQRPNSGVYLQRRYEIQVLDSFGIVMGKHDCGVLYAQVTPAVNMCFPPLTWQTYDIDFTAARFDNHGAKIKPARCTVRLNGVVTIDDVEIKGPTPGGIPETPEPGNLYLQKHGHPSFYRNVWVLEKK